MVRIKQRYILFDILYPPSADGRITSREDFDEFSQSELNALLSLHQSSPSSISQKALVLAIRKSLQTHFGDFGVGCSGMQLQVKYFSNKTSTGIVRCGRGHFELVVAALALIQRIEDQNVIIRCTHVSGTIKKCEQYSIKKTKELMHLVSRSEKQGISKWMSSFKESDDINIISDHDRDDDN